MSFLRRVGEWAEEGHRHGIPTCCGLRFGLEAERPKVLPRLGYYGLRLHQRIQVFTWSPRHKFAVWDNQGYVPCEYHLLRWFLAGKRPSIRQDVEDTPKNGGYTPA